MPATNRHLPNSAALLALVLLALPVSCAGRSGAAPRVTPIESPAAPNSGEPDLAVSPDGAVHLSWFERADSNTWRLRIARLNGNTWSPPATVAEGDSFFVNWADFPRLIAPAPNRLLLSWPWRRAGGTYAYEVRSVFSADGGATWGPVRIPHAGDPSPTEHGFVSMAPERDGVRMVWLDGRAMDGKEEGEGEMSLRTAWVGPDGTPEPDELLDPRVCDCCQTSAVATGAGTLVAFRDRDSTEVRDTGLLLLAGGTARPVAAPADGWSIHGCPVNGPSLAAGAGEVALAWYTAPGDSARVQIAFAAQAAGPFSAPLRVDEGDPLGRVATAWLPKGGVAVAWLERSGKGASLRVRRFTPDGTRRRSIEVARTGSARASGFPRLAVDGERLIVAWTDDQRPARVRVASLPIASL